MKTNYITYRTILFLMLAFCLFDCEVEYPYTIKPSNISRLVVDGLITNENKAQCIKLSGINAGINLPYAPVSKANISVTDSSNTYFFTESATEPGSYYSAPFGAVVGKTYYLSITYQSWDFHAKASMVPITPLDKISISSEKGLYKYNHSNYGDPAMVEVYFDWSPVPTYCKAYGSCTAQETFYILYNVDVNKEFGADKETIYFPIGTKIVRHKYSLSAEHQAFLRSMLMETEWRGGIFDVEQGNVSTNISNGGLGFFGACMVLTDSLVVK